MRSEHWPNSRSRRSRAQYRQVGQDKKKQLSCQNYPKLKYCGDITSHGRTDRMFCRCKSAVLEVMGALMEMFKVQISRLGSYFLRTCCEIRSYARNLASMPLSQPPRRIPKVHPLLLQSHSVSNLGRAWSWSEKHSNQALERRD